MGKYGIGARVRDLEGDEGVIVGKEKGRRRVDYDEYGLIWRSKDALTPIAANDDAPATQERETERAEGKFKVGDRVKIVDNMTPVGMKKNLEVGSEHTITRPARAVSDGWILSGDERHWWPSAQLVPVTPEWQPKVGDRVRFKEPYSSAKAGDEGKITGFWEDDGDPTGGVYLAANGKSYSCFRYRLEPLPVAAEAQPASDSREDAGGGFKAGDRIRLVKCPLHEMPLGSEFTAVARTSGNAGSVHFTETGGRVTWRPGDYFDLVEPLTITAGKHYRTRDGRKVGPMRPDDSFEVAAFIDVEGDGCGWSTRGKALGSKQGNGEDLVAGWVDEQQADEPTVKLAEPEPVAVAPATATPAQPAAKFKVGDHIRVKGGTLTGTIATRSPAGAMSFATDGDTVAGPEFWFDDELELVERTIRPGQFANLRVKVTSVNGKQANVIIPGLRNPSHGVPLSVLTAV